jgi:hypothetical protein
VAVEQVMQVRALVGGISRQPDDLHHQGPDDILVVIADPDQSLLAGPLIRPHDRFAVIAEILRQSDLRWERDAERIVGSPAQFGQDFPTGARHRDAGPSSRNPREVPEGRRVRWVSCRLCCHNLSEREECL